MKRGAHAEHGTADGGSGQPQDAYHFAVAAGGSHEHAEGAFLKHEEERHRDQQAENDDKQPVDGNGAARQIHRARQQRRHRRFLIAQAPDELHGFADDEDEAKREDQLVEMGAVAGAERSGAQMDGEGKIGAQHVQRAMGEVDDAQHAED
ncbi:hypothetical protein G6F24_015305 [Rhizopus arrhizus]|nr:hypothetical protein G6F24_015305 [Rhizopus arrhizus]